MGIRQPRPGNGERLMADSYKLDGQPWQNRIVGHEIVDPEQLLANPLNARVHGKLQQDATAGNLNDIGWVKSVVVNTTTGHVIDGHLRITLAMRKGEPVPVEYVKLSEAEEKQALATLDPLTNLATYDDELLDALLREVNTGDEALMEMLAGLAKDTGLYPDTTQVEPPTEFGEYGEDIETQYCCPKCGYEWSGKPK